MAEHRVTPDAFTVDGKPTPVVVDPVCGKPLELDRVEAQADHEGWAYFFCSQRCHQQFSANRARFAGSKSLEGHGAPR